MLSVAAHTVATEGENYVVKEGLSGDRKIIRC